ncbi:huntingtin, partial [Brachionus plicatilis]
NKIKEHLPKIIEILFKKNSALDSLELSHISSIPSSSSQTSFSNASNKTISKSNQSASNFSLLSLIKKPKNQPNPASQANLSTSQENKIKQLKTDQKTLSQYIKSFEAIVLKSILQYTMTSSVNLQAKIMDLLIQLILLNVDYCSLDGEKIFFDYVLKQLESMEQKRINENSKNYDPTSNSLSKSYMIDLNESFDYETVYLDPLNPFDLDAMLNKLYSHTENNFNSSSSYLATIGTSPLICLLNLRQQEHLQAHLIIPKIFEFLIELANSRQNSSKISNKDRSSGLLGMSEIMRLCDNLIASENSFHTHVLMALRPIVIDLFLNRSMEDSRELEMQHEVIIKTMLRFVHYPSIWPLLNLVVLKLKKDNVDKWKKVSRQICDSIFDSIKSSKLKILDYNGHELRSVHRYSLSYIPCIESTKSLIQLFGHLHSSVYRPIDFIIMSMFEKSKELIFQENISTNLPENLSLFILHLYLLFTNASEDQILFRLQCLTEQISQMFHNDNQANKSSRKGSLDVLNFENENISMSASSNSFLFTFDYLENGEYDFSDSALFLGKFLLKILDVSFLYVRKNFKFNPNWFISAQNLASSTNSGAFLREHEMDELLNLNMVQHLIANQLQILIYIITCEKFAKISDVLSKLINFKSELYAERKFRRENLSRSEKFNCEYNMESHCGNIF